MLKYMILFIFVSNFISSNEIQKKTEQIINQEFGKNVKIEFIKYIIPTEIKKEIERNAKQKFFSESTIIWSIKENDSLLAVGIMDNVFGKAQPITFITFFNLEGIILSNHIVKYREEHGGAVSNYNWNKQFIGKTLDSEFNDIDAISGATISVNAIKKGVLKLVLLFRTLNKSEL